MLPNNNHMAGSGLKNVIYDIIFVRSESKINRLHHRFLTRKRRWLTRQIDPSKRYLYMLSKQAKIEQIQHAQNLEFEGLGAADGDVAGTPLDYGEELDGMLMRGSNYDEGSQDQAFEFPAEKESDGGLRAGGARSKDSSARDGEGSLQREHTELAMPTASELADQQPRRATKRGPAQLPRQAQQEVQGTQDSQEQSHGAGIQQDTSGATGAAGEDSGPLQRLRTGSLATGGPQRREQTRGDSTGS